MKKIGNGNNFIVTKEGGFAIYFINKTGSASVKGTVVSFSTSFDNAVVVCPADNAQPIGVIYKNGVADGDKVLVVISGVVEVLLQDSTSSTHGYWVRTSITQAGRANITTAAPPGGGVPELDIHMREIGHCLESKGADTDVLAKCIIHFN